MEQDTIIIPVWLFGIRITYSNTARPRYQRHHGLNKTGDTKLQFSDKLPQSCVQNFNFGLKFPQREFPASHTFCIFGRNFFRQAKI